MLHSHLKLPKVLTQMWWQPWSADSHSSFSVPQKKGHFSLLSGHWRWDRQKILSESIAVFYPGKGNPSQPSWRDLCDRRGAPVPILGCLSWIQYFCPHRDTTMKFSLMPENTTPRCRSTTSGGHFCTFDEARSEAGFLHWAVRDELNVEFVGRRPDVLGHFVATVFAYEWWIVFMAVSHLQVIVHAVIVVFHLRANGEDWCTKRNTQRSPDHSTLCSFIHVRFVNNEFFPFFPRTWSQSNEPRLPKTRMALASPQLTFWQFAEFVPSMCSPQKHFVKTTECPWKSPDPHLTVFWRTTLWPNKVGVFYTQNRNTTSSLRVFWCFEQCDNAKK